MRLNKLTQFEKEFKMELIIVLVIVGIIIAFLVFQRKKELVTDNTNSSLPVVEPSKEQQATDVPVSAPEVKSLPAYAADDGPLSEKQMEQIAQVMNAPTTVVTPDPVAETPVVVVKEKKPRKPRAPKVVQLGTDGQSVATKRKPRSKKV